MITRVLLALVAGTLAQVPSAVAASHRAALAGLDTLVAGELERQKIPGAAVAVVVGGEVVVLQGYGWRDLEARRPVTADTLFPIASVTKQFTVAALGTLAREGRLDWDAPVRDYLPDFRLHDDHATSKATPRDLVTHRIGLPRHDLAWFGSPLSREELYGRLRHLPFSADIRARFQYNNFMYMTAGYLAGRVAGVTYEEHVRRSLLQPLHMTRTGFSLAELSADSDAAKGYQLDDQRRLVPDAYESAEQMAPTGGLNSTVRDLARWVRMLLGGGELDGQRILLKSDVDAMLRPNVPVGPSLFPEFGHQHYGMGLFVSSYRGREIAQHGGNMPGAAAMVLLIPSEKIGVVVLTNRSGARLRDGLPYEIADRLLGLPSAGLVARYAELEAKMLAGEDAAVAAGVSDRRTGTSPSHALAEYAGGYAAPGYGPLEVAVEDGALRLRYHGFAAPLEHWHYDVFRTPPDRTARLSRVRVKFETDLEGAIAGVTVPIEPSVPPVLFARQPPAEMTERTFLARLTGTYELAGLDVEVVLRDDGVLQWVQRGQARELLPVRGTLFRIKGLSGVSVEFLSSAEGRVERLAVHSGSSAIAPRKK